LLDEEKTNAKKKVTGNAKNEEL